MIAVNTFLCEVNEVKKIFFLIQILIDKENYFFKISIIILFQANSK